MNTMDKPLPRITPDAKPFWDALRERRVLLPFCLECGKPHLPPGPVCPFCFTERIEWRPASGRRCPCRALRRTPWSPTTRPATMNDE